jgi:hypothetical protein
LQEKPELNFGGSGRGEGGIVLNCSIDLVFLSVEALELKILNVKKIY